MIIETLLSEFPVVVSFPVAWGEMDAFQHVNNIVYFRYFESARIAYFESIGYNDLAKREGLGPILASTDCRFKMPLTYPDTVRIGARVTSLEQDRFTMEYTIVSQTHNRVAASGHGVIVSFDYRANTKTALPERIVAAIWGLEGWSASHDVHFQ